MATFGMLYPKGKLLKEETYRLYAEETEKRGNTLLFFTKEGHVEATNTVQGYVLINGRWRKKEDTVPTIIFIFDRDLLDQHPQVENVTWIPLPSDSLLRSPWEFFKSLYNRGLEHELIPSEQIKSSGHFLRLLKAYRRLLVKATSSVQHYLVEQKGNRYFVTASGEATVEKTRDDLRQWMIDRQREDQHVAQPHLLCQTKEREVIDFRVVLTKKEGRWNVSQLAPRFYLRDDMFLSEQDIESFFIHDFPYNSVLTQRRLEIFSTNFIEKIEKALKDIEELELYLKLDDLKAIWVDELKWTVNGGELVSQHLDEGLKPQKEMEGDL